MDPPLCGVLGRRGHIRCRLHHPQHTQLISTHFRVHCGQRRYSECIYLFASVNQTIWMRRPLREINSKIGNFYLFSSPTSNWQSRYQSFSLDGRIASRDSSHSLGTGQPPPTSTVSGSPPTRDGLAPITEELEPPEEEEEEERV